VRKTNHTPRVAEEISPILMELKGRLQEFYGDSLVKLLLFGSRARGDNEPDSDLDILAVLRISAREVERVPYPTDIVMDLLDRHNLLVTILEMDEYSFRHRQGPLLRNIRREGVAVD